MPSPIEKLACQCLTVAIAHRPQAHPHEVVLPVVFAQRDAQACALDAKGLIDQSLGIALDEVKPPHIFARNGEIGSACVFKILHPLVEYIPPESHGPLRIVVENLLVDFFLVDVFFHQLAHHKINFRIVAIHGEGHGVGHHAAIDGCGSLLIHLFISAQLTDNAENHLRGAAEFRLRHDDFGFYIWVEVVINEHATRFRAYEQRFHLIHPGGGIEIETEHQVGLFKGLRSTVGMSVVANYFFGVGHPAEEIGKLVGHDHGHLLATLFGQIAVPCN